MFSFDDFCDNFSVSGLCIPSHEASQRLNCCFAVSLLDVAYLFLALCGIYRIVTVSYCSSPRLDGGLHGLSRRDSRGWSGKTILAALNVVLATSPLAFVAWTLAQGERQIPLTEGFHMLCQTLGWGFSSLALLFLFLEDKPVGLSLLLPWLLAGLAALNYSLYLYEALEYDSKTVELSTLLLKTVPIGGLGSDFHYGALSRALPSNFSLGAYSASRNGSQAAQIRTVRLIFLLANQGLTCMVLLVGLTCVQWRVGAGNVPRSFRNVYPPSRGLTANRAATAVGSRPGWLFLPVNRLFYIGYSRQLNQGDIPLLPEGLQTKENAMEFVGEMEKEKERALIVEAEEHLRWWEKEATRRRQSDSRSRQTSSEPMPPSSTNSPLGPLLMLGFRLYGRKVIKIFSISCCLKAVQLASPLFLHALLSFLETPKGFSPLWTGWALTAAMVLRSVFDSLLSVQLDFQYNCLGVQIKTALTSAVFIKTLYLSLDETQTYSSGVLANLISVDVDRISSATRGIADLVLIPLQVGISFYLINREISIAFLAGVAVICLIVPINAFVTCQIQKVTQEMLRQRDQRVKVCSELLHGIKPLKMYGWENVIADKASAFRSLEMAALGRRKYLDAICVFLWATTPVLISFATFATVVFLGEELTAARAFTAVSLLNTLIFPMNAFPWIINGLLEARVSARRLQKFIFVAREKPAAMIDQSSVVNTGNSLFLASSPSTAGQVTAQVEVEEGTRARRLLVSQRSRSLPHMDMSAGHGIPPARSFVSQSRALPPTAAVPNSFTLFSPLLRANNWAADPPRSVPSLDLGSPATMARRTGGISQAQSMVLGSISDASTHLSVESPDLGYQDHLHRLQLAREIRRKFNIAKIWQLAGDSYDETSTMTALVQSAANAGANPRLSAGESAETDTWRASEMDDRACDELGKFEEDGGAEGAEEKDRGPTERVPSTPQGHLTNPWQSVAVGQQESVIHLRDETFVVSTAPSVDVFGKGADNGEQPEATTPREPSNTDRERSDPKEVSEEEDGEIEEVDSGHASRSRGDFDAESSRPLLGSESRGKRAKDPQQNELSRDSPGSMPSLRRRRRSSSGRVSSDMPFMLKNISISVPRGGLAVVCGPTAAGKSSLLLGLLGELQTMRSGRDEPFIRGTHSFAAQTPWLMAGKIRDNILAGLPFDRRRYKEVVRVCALHADFEQIEGRDLAEIGERGSTLSGGQKARVCLARAIYKKADVYLLDDPLSAVDAHVAKYILEECLGPSGFLAKEGAARVLVTHAVHLLPMLSSEAVVYVMDRGEIVESGSVSFLFHHKSSNYLLASPKAASEEGEKSYTLTADVGQKDSRGRTNRRTGGDVGWRVEEEQVEKGGREKMSDVGERRRSGLQRVDVAQSRTVREGAAIWAGGFSNGRKELNEGGLTRGKLSQQVGERKLGRRNISWEGDEDADVEDVVRLMSREGRDFGAVKNETILHYFRSAGCCLCLVVAVSLILMQASRNGSDLWLAYWTTHQGDDRWFLKIMGLFVVATAFFAIGRSFVYAYGGLRAAVALHSNVLYNLVKAPLVYFDETPVGRLVNRLSSDQYAADESLPFILNIFLAQLVGLLGILTVFTYQNYLFVVCLLPLGGVYFFVQRYYRRTSREMKRLESISRSPVYSYFNEVAAGIVSVRALRLEKALMSRFLERLDLQQRNLLASSLCSAWLALRLEFLAVIVIAFLSALAMVQYQFSKDTPNAGLVGLALAYAFTIVSTLNGLVSTFTETEKLMISVERLQELSVLASESSADSEDATKAESEDEHTDSFFSSPFTSRLRRMLSPKSDSEDELHAANELNESDSDADRVESGVSPYQFASKSAEAEQGMPYSYVETRPETSRPRSRPFSGVFQLRSSQRKRKGRRTSTGSRQVYHGRRSADKRNFKDWPAWGEICITGLEARYRPELPPSLKDISLAFHAGERVGICGRTGAGKSTLVLCLFRLVNWTGLIYIDGINIKKIPLRTLRGKLGVIPQDPLLFSGTIRFNLDPCYLYTDDELWHVLRQCHLRKAVKRLQGGLNAEVYEGGANFSVGQRQLLCLARALLRRSSVVCFDEATASVDAKTDRLLQQTIRKEFESATLITIAHRLSTVLDNDRVVVLENGRVVEVGAPSALLATEGSAFAKLKRSQRA